MSLEIRDLQVFYDDFHVLHDISLTVPEGALGGVAGANGHGKSTLLKAICGLVAPRAGEIRWRGDRIDGHSAPDLVARGIAHVAEHRHLFMDMTVEENLLLGAYLPRGRTRLKESLERVFALYPRLSERSRQIAGTLSGGEAQMLALGRGLMSGAELLAIDEPSLGLSPALTEGMLETIAAINKLGVTVLLVEQSLPLIADLVDPLFEIVEGRIAAAAEAVAPT